MSSVEKISLAIEGENLVSFFYGGGSRIAEPYEVGVSADGWTLFRGYQKSGYSSRGRPAGWKLFSVSHMSDIQVQSDSFTPRASYYSLPSPWISNLVKSIP